MSNIEAPIVANLLTWLAGQVVASGDQPAWLLAYCDDAVRWGRVEAGALALAPGQGLDPQKVQTAHVFGDLAEVRVWRTGTGFAHARLSDAGVGNQDMRDASYMLWGTAGKDIGDRFTEVWDGVQGLRHSVPLPVSFAANGKARPIRLAVRHYLGYEHDQARITHSRLVALRTN